MDRFRTEERRTGWAIIETEEGHIVASCIDHGSDGGEFVARRIANCLNACEGIPDPAEFIRLAKKLMEIAKGGAK